MPLKSQPAGIVVVFIMKIFYSKQIQHHSLKMFAKMISAMIALFLLQQ